MGMEIDQCDATSKKYRIGNQPEEYELVTTYLGWNPAEGSDWDWWCDIQLTQQLRFEDDRRNDPPDSTVKLISPDKRKEVVLYIHQELGRDSFPFGFTGETRSRRWHKFAIVSTRTKMEEKFIIPLH